VVTSDPNRHVGATAYGDGVDTGEGLGLIGEGGDIAARDGQVGELEPLVRACVTRFQVHERIVRGSEQRNTDRHRGPDREVLPAVTTQITRDRATQDAHHETSSTGVGVATRRSFRT
jgi:hypothetical protein